MWDTRDNDGQAKRVKTRKTAGGSARGGIFVAALFILLTAVYLLYSLFTIMVNDHEAYAQEAARQHYRQIVDYPERGEIRDANGYALAVNNYVYTIGITPASLNTIPAGRLPLSEIVSGIARILELEADWVAEQAAEVDSSYIILKKNVSRIMYNELRDFLILHQIGGVAIDAKMDRYYPAGESAAILVGFTNQEDDTIKGVNGLEAYYNDILSGTPGYTYAEVDNYSNAELPYTVPTVEEAVDGYNLNLYIDKGIQDILQEELDFHADMYKMINGAVGIIMDPKTGAILAMAQNGSYDLNDPFGVPSAFDGDEADWDPFTDSDDMDLLTSKVWLNRAISEPYEPGSTYKALTAAMSLDQRSISETQTFSDDPIFVDGWEDYPISCSVHGGHGYVTMEQGLWTSCNPVFVQVAQSMGVATFYQYVRAFGHYDITGIDLPAEVAGLQQKHPAEIDMAVNSFGEQATLTPIQMINAFAALGNGGLLLQPQVVETITDQSGNVLESHQPEVIRRVISEETSKQILEYMRGVVTEGGGATAEVPGYRVAGKTSTSTSGENEERIVISFASVTPYDDPKIVVLTILYLPEDKLLSWPSQILSRRVTERTLKYMGVQKEYSFEELETLFMKEEVRNIVGRDVQNAVQNSPIVNWDVVAEEGAEFSDIVRAQYPPADEMSSGFGRIYASVSGEIPTDLVSVPDFTGMTVDEAMDIALEAGVNVRLEGSNYRGNVTSQDIDPSDGGEETMVQRYTIIPIHFDPDPTASPTPVPATSVLNQP